MKTLLLAQAVTDHISAMTAYWDKDLICRFANAAYLNWFGKSSDQMIDKITLSELLGPLYEKNLPYIQGVLKGVAQTFEREIPLPSGEIRCTLANYFPNIINGEVVGFYVHVVDINELKLLQKDLFKSNEIFNQQNKWLTNFANVVAHDLRAHAGNLSSLLELYEIAANKSEKRVIIDYIKDLSKSFSSTIQHLSEAAKIQNMDNQQHQPCNLLEYVEAAIKTLHLQIISLNALVLTSINPDMMVLAQPAFLESIVLNLMSNAIKYYHPDRQLVINIRSVMQKDKVTFEVKDNGIGIDLQRHGKELFGLYKTFNGNADAKGIGLYITKFQVEAMGGYMQVDSTLGNGASFKVFLNHAEKSCLLSSR